MFETTNLLPIRYLQDKDNAKVFLEALLGKSISGIERFYWRTNLPEAFDLRQGKPDIYLEDQNKINMQSWSVGMGLIVAIRTQ